MDDQISPESVIGRIGICTSHFSYSQHQATFNKLIEALNLGEQLDTLFLNAQKSNISTTKLVDQASQQKLKEIFTHVLDFEHGYSLKDENYNKIIELYNLANSSERNKAEHLLALSAVFTRYSSSAVFGTELDSPLMLKACCQIRALIKIYQKIKI